MKGFQDKVAIITGGASGIGRTMGQMLVDSGARVVLADVDRDLLAEAAESLGERASGVALDVTDAAAVKRVVDQVAEEYGHLDYMFNNAGISIVGEAIDLSLDDWRRTLDIDLMGVIHGVVAAYPVMVRQGFGHIVNTSSLAGITPTPGMLPYSTAKHAVVGLSIGLRAEAVGFGVKVSVVCPGFIKTPIFDNIEVRHLDREMAVANIPFKLGEVEPCTRQILRGVRKNKAVIVVTGHAKRLSRLYRFLPWLVHAGAPKVAEKSRRARVEE